VLLCWLQLQHLINVSKSTFKFVPAGIAALAAAEQGEQENGRREAGRWCHVSCADAATTVGRLSVEIAKATKALTKREYMGALVEDIDLTERPAEKQKL
jgi:hypothetical protein